MSRDPADALHRYLDFFRTLSPASLTRIPDIFAPEAIFSDPFGTAKGQDAIRAVFEKMFSRLHRPKFEIVDYGFGQRAGKAYIAWVFHYSWSSGAPARHFTGMSEVSFDADGKVARHDDYWDAVTKFYRHLPFIGRIFRLFPGAGKK